MSHFTVLVVGDNYEDQLAPYHEFECTGENDQYIQEIDQTEEAREEYLRETNTTTMYKDLNGDLHSPYTDEGNYDPAYWREPTREELRARERFASDGTDKNTGLRWGSTDWKDGQGYRAKVFAMPDGWTEVEIPKAQAETFADFCESWYGHKPVPFGQEPDTDEEHKYGYTLVDEKGEVIKTVDRTNPNAKWDWYQVGGRWNGYFKLKSGALGLLGEPGIQTMNKDYKPPKATRADQCIKGDIDIAGMRDEAGENAAETYDMVMLVIGGLPKPLSWRDVQFKFRKDDVLDTDGGPKNVDWEKAREFYNSQPAVKALRSNEETIWQDAEKFNISREQYIQNARKAAIATFAVVKDSKWFERGEMGWWGVVRDEKDRDDWTMQFSSLIDDLPDSTMLTVVDCHI